MADVNKLRDLEKRVNTAALNPEHFNRDYLGEVLSEVDDAFSELLAIAEAYQAAPWRIVNNDAWAFADFDMVGQRVRIVSELVPVVEGS